MKKFYAVKNGRTTGIFDNWPECQKSISGFSDADYKGFSTKEEAEAYLSGKDLYEDIIKTDIDEGYVVAFCDGSFDATKKRYSYGVLIIDDNQIEHGICGSEKNEKYISTQNIIGEIRGAIVAMDWAVSNGFSKIKIYHDYEGVAKWIMGEWEAKSEVAKMYVGLFNKTFSDILEVKFAKVKGHSHNKYNDQADELARRALVDYERIPVSGDNWFTVQYVEENELNAALDLLSRDFKEVSIDEKHLPAKDVYKISFTKEKISVTRFKSQRKKLLVQGSNCTLFQIFTTYIYELLGKKAETIFNGVYRKKIDISKINEKLNSICPNFPADYPENIKCLLRQSIINLDNAIDCEDYSQFAFPALRALDGHMKYLFNKIGKPVASKASFSYFQKDNASATFFLPQGFTSDLSVKQKLEDCYNYFAAQRHTLFHFGDLTGTIDSTRIINIKEEADEIIKDCIKLICE